MIIPENKNIIAPLLFYFVISFGLVSCRGNTQELNETPTRGKTRISVDESFQLLIDSEINTFMTLYPYAYITAEYKPEYDVIADFMNDSVKVVVSSYKLLDNQVEKLRTQLIVARTTTIAHDALALIINKENIDSLLNYNTIQDIFHGKISNWKQINDQSNLDDISVVFDHSRSGNVRYFKEKFGIKDTLPDNFYALNSNEEVINYISESRNGLGIISVNWISDPDDSLSMSFINKIKVVGVSQPYLDENTFYLPYQGSIYNKTYPFTREVYCHSRETFAGLGSGLISWLAAEKGQRIILKSGLVPATMPIRLVMVETE
jgi:phosphate transport system substrate-binding protein